MITIAYDTARTGPDADRVYITATEILGLRNVSCCREFLRRPDDHGRWQLDVAECQSPVRLHRVLRCLFRRSSQSPAYRASPQDPCRIAGFDPAPGYEGPTDHAKSVRGQGPALNAERNVARGPVDVSRDFHVDPYREAPLSGAVPNRFPPSGAHGVGKGLARLQKGVADFPEALVLVTFPACPWPRAGGSGPIRTWRGANGPRDGSDLDRDGLPRRTGTSACGI